MFLLVTRVTHLSGFKLRLEFGNGVTKDVDLAEELYEPAFAPLREEEYFRRVFLSPESGTIEWPNGASFLPEYLFDIGVRVLEPPPEVVLD